MSNTTINTEQGHWILAKMGKKVLRPGGRILTQNLVDSLKITSEEAIVEFAPGLGHTAQVILKKNPKSYTGIELNEEAAERLKTKLTGKNRKIINTNAANTGLDDASADKVVGEAMLTMQADARKSEIIKEAYRILKKGGNYGIHELGLKPDSIDPKIKADIQQKLAKTIRVNARPLTQTEWCNLLKQEGFTIKTTQSAPMNLLKPKRLISDEGIFRTLKIGFNVLTHPKERKRILEMRKIFTEYKDHLTAFAIVAEK